MLNQLKFNKIIKRFVSISSIPVTTIYKTQYRNYSSRIAYFTTYDVVQECQKLIRTLERGEPQNLYNVSKVFEELLLTNFKRIPNLIPSPRNQVSLKEIISNPDLLSKAFKEDLNSSNEQKILLNKKLSALMLRFFKLRLKMGFLESVLFYQGTKRIILIKKYDLILRSFFTTTFYVEPELLKKRNRSSIDLCIQISDSLIQIDFNIRKLFQEYLKLTIMSPEVLKNPLLDPYLKNKLLEIAPEGLEGTEFNFYYILRLFIKQSDEGEHFQFAFFNKEQNRQWLSYFEEIRLVIAYYLINYIHVPYRSIFSWRGL